MRNTQRRTVLAVAALAAALALGACAGDDELATTETELSDDERLAQLEAELQELRSDDRSEDADEPADETDPGVDSDDAGSEDDGSDFDATTAARIAAERIPEPRVIEVGETYAEGPFSLTVERLVIQEHYVEVEVTAVNDHPESRWRIWNGSNASMPIMFDELDGRFGYQHIAGYNPSGAVELQPGERLDAVMVFGGRLRPQVEELTIQFRGTTSLLDWELTVPVGQVQP